MKQFQVWFSSGKGTGVYINGRLVEWYVCFEGSREECDSYVSRLDHYGAKWRVEAVTR